MSIRFQLKLKKIYPNFKSGIKMKAKSKIVEEKVYTNAETLLARHGTRGWNMNDLAAASGITKRTLYKIITTKEQLIRDIAFSNINSIKNRVSEIIRNEPDFPACLDRLILAIPELFRNNYINNYSEILGGFPELEAELVKENEKITDDLVEFFRQGIDKGYLRNDLTPQMIQQMLQAFVIYFAKYSKNDEEIGENMRIALHSLVNGIKPQA